MIVRLLRNLAGLATGSLLVYVARRVVDERRHEQRLAAPVAAWPEVPIDADLPMIPGDRPT